MTFGEQVEEADAIRMLNAAMAGATEAGATEFLVNCWLTTESSIRSKDWLTLRKLFYVLSAAAVLLSMGMECRAGDGSTHLKNGLRAYREEANFDRTISELREAVRSGLDSQTDLVQAYLYLGFAYIGKGQRMAAEAEFAKGIKLDPTMNLDPKVHSTKIVAVFNETKDRLVDSLTVVSVPGGAEVYLGGQSLGITPLRSDDVLIGEHILRVVKAYFQPRVLSIRVEKGKDNRIQVQLDKKAVELLMTSQPPEAAVYVTEEYKGRTPLSLEIVLDQELAIKIAKEEFLDKELKVKLTETGVSLINQATTESVVPIEDGVGSIHVELKLAPAPGSLRIVSDPPGATVHLDGITVGETPLIIAKVTPGTRTLRISMSRFVSVTRKIEVISGRETAVEVALGGRLHIVSIPSGAQVFVDGERMGVTPLRTRRIPAGSHHLRFKTQDTRHKTEDLTVVVERGQEKEVNIRLLPVKGSIAVSSDPPEAAIYLDGESKGNTPSFIYGVMVGQHSLKLVKAGYEDWEKQITVEELKVSWQFGKLRR
jgi:hypothetical protein